jgi:hypothetical protein
MQDFGFVNVRFRQVSLYIKEIISTNHNTYTDEAHILWQKKRKELDAYINMHCSLHDQFKISANF